jgi:hypothetical protein
MTPGSVIADAAGSETGFIVRFPQRAVRSGS